MSRRALQIAPIALAIAASFIAQQARADHSPALDRVSIWLGGYRADIEGYASIRNESNNLDTGEQKILSGKDTLQRARLDWLLFDSQGFSVDYFRVHGDRTRSVGGSFDFNGTTYDASASVSADAQIDIGNFSYRWWFGGGDTVFGLGLGAAYYRLDASLRAQANVLGATYEQLGSYNKSAWAPLVTLGWRTRISDDFRIYADVSGSKKNGSDLSGHIVNAAAGVEWFPFSNIGVGAEYGVTRIHLSQRDGNDEARLKLKLNGPALYLRARF